MGASTFETLGTGHSAREAFQSAVENARWEHGHGGYTGTIAEKNEFVMIPLPEDRANDWGPYARELIDQADPRIDDKWGPAGCIELPENMNTTDGKKTYLFFGWASE